VRPRRHRIGARAAFRCNNRRDPLPGDHAGSGLSAPGPWHAACSWYPFGCVLPPGAGRRDDSDRVGCVDQAWEVAREKMKPLSVDEIRELLPELDDLRPLMDEIIASARPDEDRRWSGSGELGTVGQRLVDFDEVVSRMPRALAARRAHLEEIYESVSNALRGLAGGDSGKAVEALLGGAAREAAEGCFAEAQAFVEAALRLVSRGVERTALLPAYLAGARIARAEGRWELAEARYREAFTLARDAGDAQGAATASMGMGNLAVDRGRWDLALSRYEETGRWVAQLTEDAPERWQLELNLSIVHREMGRLDGAREHLDTATRLAGNEPAPEVGAILANARGQLLRALERTEEAEVAFRHALSMSREPDASVTIGVNLAEVLLDLGHALEAGEVARTTEEQAISRGVVPRLPEVYRTLGQVAAARGHADAFVFFERALAVVRERRLPDFERAQSLEAYGRYQEVTGEEEGGRARLEEAMRIYEHLGCQAAAKRVRSRLQRTEHSQEREEDGHENDQ
jgi:tetratricopeptide (TPR) repeat protein